MIPAELGFDASAILLWFPSGEVPTDEDFKPRDEDPRAEKYWFRHEAVLDAVHAAVKGRRPPGYDPWIKYGDVLLDEHGIELQYKRLTGSDPNAPRI